nr:uncharacterized protein LOC110381803 [Helicoverpa armigera]
MGVQSTPRVGRQGVQSTPLSGMGVKSTSMDLLGFLSTAKLGDPQKWLTQTTVYKPVETWVSELFTKSMDPTFNENANAKSPQLEDTQVRSSIANNMATTFSPGVRQGRPASPTHPDDYGYSTATGQQDKFISENNLGMVALGTTPEAGDHTMTTMIEGAPAYRPYEVTMSTAAGDVLAGLPKVIHPTDILAGDKGSYMGPPLGHTGPEGMPGPDEIGPGMTPPPGMINPYKRFDAMMEELDEGYMVTFLIELTRLVATKDRKHVYEVIGHMEMITNDMYQKAEIAWFGHPLVEATMSIGRFLTEAEPDAVQGYASMLHHLLRTRHSMLATDVNSLIDYADMLYEHEEGYMLFESLMEFEIYPNTTDRTGRQVCDFLIESFLRPFRRLYHSERRQALLDSINYALKIRFPEYSNMRRSNEKGVGSGREKKHKRPRHQKKRRRHHRLRKKHERRNRHRKHRHAHKQRNSHAKRRINDKHDHLNIKSTHKKPKVNVKRRHNTTTKTNFERKTKNKKSHSRTAPSFNIKTENYRRFQKATEKPQFVFRKAKFQNIRPKKQTSEVVTSIYLSNNIAKSIERPKTESVEELLKHDDHLSLRKSMHENKPTLLLIQWTGGTGAPSSVYKNYLKRQRTKIKAKKTDVNEDSNKLPSERIHDIQDEKVEQNRRLQRLRKSLPLY